MASFTVIDHTEMTNATTTVWSKTSIPSSYDHLLLMASARTDYGSNYTFPKITFNGDTGTNYSDTELRTITTSSAPSSTRNTSNAYIQAGTVNGSSPTADSFGSFKMWIPNYAGTTGYKAVAIYCTAGGLAASHGTFNVNMTAGLWHSTAAIDEIHMAAHSGSFVQYSEFTLYGVSA